MDDVRAVGEQARLEEQRALDQEVERRIKAMTAAYSEAARYANVIVLAGYAAFFTMLSALRDSLGEGTKLWASALMMLSILVFVGWEVAKMVYTAVQTRRQAIALRGSNPIAELDAVVEAVRRSAPMLMTLWIFVIVPAVAFALMGICVLIHGIIVKTFAATFGALF